MIRFLFSACCMFSLFNASGQKGYWQQQVKYQMDINVDAARYQFKGKQVLQYTNNSHDTLKQLFYHLYWNAFQPNSMMDTRSRELGKGKKADWDSRVRDRILYLKEDEIGYQRVLSLKLNGVAQKFKEQETILQVYLSQPIAPGQTVSLDMNFEAQVPVQIRRSGRNAANGVAFSMAQWYPKICEYDEDGWHPNPYVAREFYGVWGDFDVNITMDKRYIIGGTGYLTNASSIGYGYEAAGTKVPKPQGNTLTWKFSAPKVHDFVWAADIDFKHIVKPLKNGPVIHVLYKNVPGNTANDQAWQNVADAAEMVYPYIKEHFGEYPYKQYSFIQGGDGGMEYPMATLLNGPGLGTVFHEWMHTWYQMILATNESLYAWMDEGFTEFATERVEDYYYSELAKKTGSASSSFGLPRYHSGNYDAYFGLVRSGKEEPLTTHADHFNTNYAYSYAAYSKGCVFLAQLGYVIGEQVRDRVLKTYYNEWRFKHPDINDFMRVAEKESGLQLDWYKEYWVNSTKTIDYSIDSLWEEQGQTKIRLRRKSEMPMPIDLQLTFKDGTNMMHYVPMYLMFGEKAEEDNLKRDVHPSWKWTHPTYTLTVNRRLTDLVLAEIDPSYRMADTDRKNNRLELKW
jgi:hypothetical protein